MLPRLLRIVGIFVLVVLLRPPGAAEEGKKRVPWTTSRIKGTPEPPHPYRAERAFPKLTFHEPVFLVRTRSIDRWFLGERGGKIYSFPRNPKVEKADLVIDFTRDVQVVEPGGKVRKVNQCYALAFHPQFAKNRYCYVCYLLDRNGDREDGTRIARFKMTDTDPPRIDAKTEMVVLTFKAGGHNGCDLHFGHDGFLYISTGDATGPNPPDALDTGQDLSDLYGSILRIDVDRTENGNAYAIPPDNPFVKTANARPEIYAYGLRNPWRMSFDRATGDLWVGDVGWELWEMVYRVQKGGNYGWSVKEGRQEIRPNAKRGPTPILPPTIDFPHTDAASITGGYVYHGKRLPELRGAYICGDWVTRKLWATKFDGDRIVWHKEIAHGAQRVVAFGEDDDGELYYLHHDEQGSIHHLVPNEAAAAFKDTFPRKLSGTGLFETTRDHRLAPGVVPFQINAPRWADHARAERFVAIPGANSAKLFDQFVRVESEFYGSYFFPPPDTILGKTLSLELERGKPASRRRLETQILHFDGKVWRGYSYLWNEAGTDAELVEPAGADLKLDVTRSDALGKQRQTWHVPSRGQCMTCHNPWAGIALAFTPRQLDRTVEMAGKKVNQIDWFKDIGLLDLKHRDWRREVPFTDALPSALIDPYDVRADLDGRARSYLQTNCAHCHQYNAGGTVDLDLRVDLPLDRTKTIGVTPVQGTFGIPEAKILAPGDPFRSTLYYRMAKLGRGRMPHLGSDLVDVAGLRLMGDWIRSMPASAELLTLVHRLRELDETTAQAHERRRAKAEIAEAAQRQAAKQSRLEPNEADQEQARAQHEQRLVRAAKDRPAERAAILKKLLASPQTALVLMYEMDQGRILPSTRPEVVRLAMVHTDPQVRDLFERFAPDSMRSERLGSTIIPEKLLALPGDLERGGELFFQPTFQCASCHTVRGKGGKVGPDLTQIASRLSKAQLLENILEPSKVIEPKYLTFVAETAMGQLVTGLLVEKNDKHVILRPTSGNDVRLPARDVVSLQSTKISLMPEQLLRDGTAQQAADLLAFLQSLK